jgi:pimeloyl-ACP methyl ester carboxylesterase
MSWPELNHSTVILHGNQDTIVPIENSRKVAEEADWVVSLIEIDDGHRMQEAGLNFAEAAKLLVESDSAV